MLTLLDVTIRDGGYVNGHTWTVEQAVSIVGAVARAGVPLIEVGYLRTPTGGDARPTARCEAGYLAAVAAAAGPAGLVVMIRPGEVEPAATADAAAGGVRLARLLAPRLDVAQTAPYLAAARAAGLATSVNLTHVSRFAPEQLAESAGRAAGLGADYVYLADSNGSMYPQDVLPRVEAVAAAVARESGALVGFHAHDNLGLAFANTCAALSAGAAALDASLGGIGKGGGNLAIETAAAHLRARHGADLRLEPLLSEHAHEAALRSMRADGRVGALVAGLLDVSLDQAPEFQEQVARHGYDALLRPAARFDPLGSLSRT